MSLKKWIALGGISMAMGIPLVYATTPDRWADLFNRILDSIATNKRNVTKVESRMTELEFQFSSQLLIRRIKELESRLYILEQKLKTSDERMPQTKPKAVPAWPPMRVERP